MFGNIAPASLGSSGTALRAPPATGMPNAPANPGGGIGGGFLGGFLGAQNNQNTPQLAQLQARLGGNSFGMAAQNQPPQAGLGNIGAQNLGTSARNGGTLAGIMAQLHPQTAQALRAIPRDTMQQLHQAGLIHPGLMAHLHGQQQ